MWQKTLYVYQCGLIEKGIQYILAIYMIICRTYARERERERGGGEGEVREEKIPEMIFGKERTRGTPTDEEKNRDPRVLRMDGR